MKRLAIILTFILTTQLTLLGNGIAITNIVRGHHLKLVSSSVNVQIENQIAITKTTQTFKNETDSTVSIKYAFPLQDGESAIQLKWYIDELWYLANIGVATDSSAIGTPTNTATKFKKYLGETNLMFPVDQELDAGDEMIVELQYVTLLTYANGIVSYNYPNNYDLIQSDLLFAQNFILQINSQRTIESLDMLNHTATEYANDGYYASIEYNAYEVAATMDYNIEYQLSLDELGLFGLSTFLPDSTVPDQGNRGFFAFIAEPDPDDNEEVIEKVFTLVLDCSGSMKGEKMTQAKNAADFIVNNLNEGDQFNICNFSTDVSFFKESHVDYTTINQDEALSYINALEANGWTNISGALTETIMQYSNVSDNTANIIIFFTDGEPTMGLTETDNILDEVEKYKADLQAPISLFTFGIGSSVNQQLLSLLATENNGIVEYLGDDEIEERITSFYSIIKSPVLLETEVSFQPAVIDDVHPKQLPNLYQGQQMLVVGRFNEPGNIGISLDGQAYSQPVNYQYNLQLADTNDVNKLFLPKVWAKMTIEDLLVEYHNHDEESEEAEAIKNQVIDISKNFGVISPFTKFSGGDPQTEIDDNEEITKSTPQDFHLLGNYPNPFNPSTSIQFFVDNSIHKIAKVKIYNSLGQLVKILALHVNGVGKYSVFWDGKLANGSIAPTGAYIYVIELNNTILSGKMTLMK